jgi:hypothetical protein
MLLDGFWRAAAGSAVGVLQLIGVPRNEFARIAQSRKQQNPLNTAVVKVVKSSDGRGASVQPVSHELVGKTNHKEEETEWKRQSLVWSARW